MTKEDLKILAITLFLGLIIAGKAIHDARAEKPKHQTKIITTFELQQRLKDMGLYKGIVDGVVGKETLAAWQEAVMRQQMKEWDLRMKRTLKK